MVMMQNFKQFPNAPKGYGWYTTKKGKYSSEGYFGRKDEPEYYWEEKLEDGVVRSRNCGVGSGCFWTDWR